MSESAKANPEDLERSRHVYRRLFDLTEVREVEPFLQQALSLLVHISDARRGYLEVHAAARNTTPTWWTACDLSDPEVDAVRASISTTIVREALARGQTLSVPSALLDPKLKASESVQRHGIEAVLCLPFGRPPVTGVLYLEGAAGASAATTRLFAPTTVERAEFFVQLISPLIARQLNEGLKGSEDSILDVRRRLRLDGIIGNSAALAQVLEQVALVAPLDVHVLLTGDSGTGKTALAKVIHANGPRASGPFVHLNCAAIPEAIFESELFGALPGSHSTAVRHVPGKVAAAQGGTLFLDEIGELSLAAQAKILHLIESKAYYPLGGNQPANADVRLIAATNVDLQLAVAERRFRDDLSFRLRVMPIRVPSLAERRADIPALAAHFCVAACERHGLPHLRLSAEAIAAIERAAWPGNVRELEFAMEAAVIRAVGGGGSTIELRHIYYEPGATPQSGTPQSFQAATRRFQKHLLEETLRETNGNVAEAARRLGLARAHVYNLIKNLDIEREPDRSG